MDTIGPSSAIGGMIALTRDPSGSLASTIDSIRRFAGLRVRSVDDAQVLLVGKYDVGEFELPRR
jgi:hypothetical protein